MKFGINWGKVFDSAFSFVVNRLYFIEIDQEMAENEDVLQKNNTGFVGSGDDRLASTITLAWIESTVFLFFG